MKISEPRSRVYFIKPVGMDGPIKIGCSGAPLGRLKTFSTWSPFELELMGSVEGGHSDETALHRRFSDMHTRHEWFMSSPLLRQTIERILGGMSVKDACKGIAEKNSIKGQKHPARTPDRVKYRLYGNQIRKAQRLVQRQNPGVGRWRQPDYVTEIMRNWRCDRVRGHEPIIPTPEQFRLLDEFIADPKTHGIFVPRQSLPKATVDGVRAP